MFPDGTLFFTVVALIAAPGAFSWRVDGSTSAPDWLTVVFGMLVGGAGQSSRTDTPRTTSSISSTSELATFAGGHLTSPIARFVVGSSFLRSI